MAPNVRVERSAASLPHIEATLSRTATSLYPHRSCWPRSRSNALLDDVLSQLTAHESIEVALRLLQRKS